MEDSFIKCYVFGDPKVGKSSLVYTYSKNSFLGEEVLSSQNYISHVSWKEKTVSLGLYDHIKDPELRKLIIQTMDIFIVCYSVSDVKSFENVENVWIPEIKKISPFTPIILVATKSDLSENQKLDDIKGSKLQKKIKSNGFVQCSAMNQENIHKCFELVIETFMTPVKVKKSQKKGLFDSSDFSTFEEISSEEVKNEQEEGTFVDLEKK
jgi:Ras homolog gene family, member U